MEVLLLLALLGGTLTVLALLDVVRATELDPTTRLVLALALILMPPIGLLVWLVVRLGRAGVLVATGLFAVAVALVVVVSEANAPRPFQVMQQGASVSSGGSTWQVRSAPAPVP